MLSMLFSPPLVGLAALFAAVVWMLRDERDRTRPLLVVALVVNLAYGSLLNLAMGKENGLFPWKYDHVLLNLDRTLGMPYFAIVRGVPHFTVYPLMLVYQLMVPMMIAWFVMAQRSGLSRSLITAYVAEMVVGPLLYGLVPACGPIYAFGRDWLHPGSIPPEVIRLSGMPNAFPSLHVGTAMVILLLSTEKWRPVAGGFLLATMLATLATGEHYTVDLAAGLLFGCFAAAAGRGRYLRSAAYLALVLTSALLVRFEHGFLLAHAWLLRAFGISSVLIALQAVREAWQMGTALQIDPDQPSGVEVTQAV